MFGFEVKHRKSLRRTWKKESPEVPKIPSGEEGEMERIVAKGTRHFHHLPKLALAPFIVVTILWYKPLR